MIHMHALGRAARFYPEWTALASSGKRTTFRELHARVGRTASFLREHGFRKRDRLALLLPNETDYIELLYACAWLGVIAVPLNIRLSTTEVDHILLDAQPRGLIRHPAMAVPTVQLEWQLVLHELPVATQGDSYPEVIDDPEAVLALIYTSGTTGHPKGVVLTHSNVLANLYHVSYWMTFKEASIYLHAAPLFHIADLPFVFGSPAFGTCQVTIPKFSPQGFCEAVERERVSHTVLVPTMLNLLTQFPDLKKYDLTSLEQIGYGGSPIGPELIRQTRQMFPDVKLLQVYGLSETGFLTALRDHEHTADRLKSCGRPCSGIEVRVVDESGKAVEPGSPGEFVARGANVMRGYWNNPDETNHAFRDGMFRTGDVGYQDADGYFYLLDRLKDMIVTGGETVYCGEVEAIICEHPAVREAAVFGIPDRQWGELVAACVVLKPGQRLTISALTTHCRRSLASYRIPRRIEFSQSDLPKSASGKILKRILRERFWVEQERAVN
jgi:acyl-CoA synthetase (AMP-forming)/AMP-acid ligase II